MRLRLMGGFGHSRAAPVLTTTAITISLGVLVACATWPPGMHIDLFEQGHWLGPASAMMNGRVPFRDTFPIHGFLADGGLDLIVFRITGASFAMSIWIRQAIGTLFQPAIFLVTVAAIRRALAAIAVLPLVLSFAPGLVFDRAVIPLIALAMFIFALDARPRPRIAACAGCLGVLGVFYSLDFGTFVLLAEVLSIMGLSIFERNSQAIFPTKHYVTGALTVSVIAGGALVLVGALSAFVTVSFVNLPRDIGRVWGLRFPRPWEIGDAWAHGRALLVFGTLPVGPAHALRLYAILLVTALVLGVLWRRASTTDRAMLWRVAVLAMANLFFFRYVYGRFHYEAGNALVVPLLTGAAVLARRDSELRRAIRLLPIIAVMALGLALGGLNLTTAMFRAAMTVKPRLSTCPHCVRLNEMRAGGPQVPDAEAASLVALCAAITQAAPQGPILDLSNRPALYYFLNRHNPTRFYQVPMMEPFQAEIIHDLARNPPTLIILSSGTSLDSFDGRTNQERIPHVWAYLTDRYTRRIAVGSNILALQP